MNLRLFWENRRLKKSVTNWAVLPQHFDIPNNTVGLLVFLSLQRSVESLHLPHVCDVEKQNKGLVDVTSMPRLSQRPFLYTSLLFFWSVSAVRFPQWFVCLGEDGKRNGNIFPKPNNFQLCTAALCNTGGMNSCCNVQETFPRALIMSPHFDKVLKRNVCASGHVTVFYFFCLFFFSSLSLLPSSLLLSRRSSAETLKRYECLYTNLKTSMPWWGHTVTWTQGFTGSCKPQAFVTLKSENIINNFNILQKTK